MKKIRIDSTNMLTLEGEWKVPPFSIEDIGVDQKTGKMQVSIGFKGSDFPGGVFMDGIIPKETCVEVNNHPYEGKHFKITGPKGSFSIRYTKCEDQKAASIVPETVRSPWCDTQYLVKMDSMVDVDYDAIIKRAKASPWYVGSLPGDGLNPSSIELTTKQVKGFEKAIQGYVNDEEDTG